MTSQTLKYSIIIAQTIAEIIINKHNTNKFILKSYKVNKYG